MEKLAQQEFAAGNAPRTRLRSLSCSIFATQVEGISGYGPPFDGRIELQDADESEFMDVQEGISDKNYPVVNGPLRLLILRGQTSSVSWISLTS